MSAPAPTPITARQLLDLLKQVEDEADRRHESGVHDGCLICEVAHVIAGTRSINQMAVVAIIMLLRENDAAEICIMLASFFAAGALYASQKEQVQ